MRTVASTENWTAVCCILVSSKEHTDGNLRYNKPQRYGPEEDTMEEMREIKAAECSVKSIILCVLIGIAVCALLVLMFMGGVGSIIAMAVFSLLSIAAGCSSHKAQNAFYLEKSVDKQGE